MQALLEGVRDGRVAVEEGLAALSGLPLLAGENLRLDLQREARCGFPEVVFGAGKTPAEVVAAATALARTHGRMLATRLEPDAVGALLEALPGARHHERARMVSCGEPADDELEGHVLVVAAGTADAPVADEAALTARMMGARVERLADVGVAGLGRLLAEVETLRRAEVIVVVAGMEGALPSVVGGLVDCPVIAVPTSVGYGAGLPGLAALLGMLHSCAPGLTVVNIDNGFGAGYAAGRINRRVSAGWRERT